MSIDVIPLGAFRDNYIWCLRHAGFAVVVDPGDAAPVLRHLAHSGERLAAVVITHHHADHVGGIGTLLAQAQVPVIGPAGESIPGRTLAVRGGDRVPLPQLGLTLEVLDVPGHTAGHVAYHAEGMLFCGDTLFAGGCGRLFEGTAAQMWDSLSQLAALPGDTRVYCAHEYTLSNLAFALQVEPGNERLQQRRREAAALREAGRPTLPSTIELERATNPFLRAREPAVAAAAVARGAPDAGDPAGVFAALREWKNQA